MEHFEAYRYKLFTIAYKMTKRVADAEDIVQDTFIVVGSRPLDTIQDIEGYLVRSVMNRCLTLLEKNKHITYPGIDLPEPLFTEKFQQVQSQDVSYALTVLLQTLNPLERAVFLLKETLEYSYPEVADIVSIKEDHCRQLFHRAKEKLAEGKPRHIPSPASADRLIRAFLQISEQGDLQQLMACLKEDVAIYSDGGGKVTAARNVITGREHCLAFLSGVYDKMGAALTPTVTRINGEPGLIFYNTQSGAIDTVMMLVFDDEAITTIYFMRNPDKLTPAA
ncbi:sigma-70 family RNA polymerase sigma factor [Fulvivirgaceae bacterium PWU5]|uniref:Sigma-70 family RNA polymerase sigma factor n=1 Tax=Dawidia cretensis TaxID=2782350 RepID=A0AAP2E4J2_9BACT|nr:sigma-70 family RNA polymerase sigma factor [Dawidia cretensis]MBT1711647.1 sigma-70 family RNA polymerase sigma factor [Dawidia cretensis]